MHTRKLMGRNKCSKAPNTCGKEWLRTKNCVRRLTHPLGCALYCCTVKLNTRSVGEVKWERGNGGVYLF